MPVKGNIIRQTHNNKKGADYCWCLFCYPQREWDAWNNQMGSICFQIVACFKFEIEHEDLYRNKAKIKLLNTTTDQQLRKVVAKCSVWW